MLDIKQTPRVLLSVTFDCIDKGYEKRSLPFTNRKSHKASEVPETLLDKKFKVQTRTWQQKEAIKGCNQVSEEPGGRKNCE